MSDEPEPAQRSGAAERGTTVEEGPVSLVDEEGTAPGVECSAVVHDTRRSVSTRAVHIHGRHQRLDVHKRSDRPMLGVVPLSTSLARLNRHLTNRFVSPIAKVAPLLGVVHHVGRRSGNEYRTPVTPVPYLDGYVIALVYGKDADWVENVFAAGGCRLETRGRIMDMTQPQFLPTGEGLQAMPAVTHLILTRLNVIDFLYLHDNER
jgi:deazaflavin-dependent oxidoreductase (nitroreductase family)